MDGKRNMTIGGAWLLGGLVVTGISHEAASNGGGFTIAVGAIVLGGVQLLYGLFQTMSVSVGGEQIQSEFSERVLLLSMLAVAAADGEIGDEEIDGIADIYKRLLGEELSRTWAKNTAVEMVMHDFDIHEALATEKHCFNSEYRALVLKAAFLVGVSDGDLQDEEFRVINKLSFALGMSDAEVDRVMEQLDNVDS